MLLGALDYQLLEEPMCCCRLNWSWPYIRKIFYIYEENIKFRIIFIPFLLFPFFFLNHPFPSLYLSIILLFFLYFIFLFVTSLLSSLFPFLSLSCVAFPSLPFLSSPSSAAQFFFLVLRQGLILVLRRLHVLIRIKSSFIQGKNLSIATYFIAPKIYFIFHIGFILSKSRYAISLLTYK